LLGHLRRIVHQPCETTFLWVHLELWPGAPAAQLIDDAAAGDLEHPGPEGTSTWVEALRVLPDGQKNVLDDLFHLSIRAQFAIGMDEQSVPVSFIQEAESRLIIAAYSPDQVLISV